MKKLFIICLSGLFFFNLKAQKEIKIQLSAILNSEKLLVNNLKDIETKELQVSKLKFYISEIKLWNKQKAVYSEKNSFHLIDFQQNESLFFNINSKKNLSFDKISFTLGIDSTTNHSGVQGGDLDPTKGMYWAWQSGYINFKIEGKSELCKSKNNEFFLHLGGFLNGNKCNEKIDLVVKNEDVINININLDAFFEKINLSKQYHIMSPGNEAVSISNTLAKCFSIIENEE